MKKFRIGLVQMDSGPDMDQNMKMAEYFLEEAVQKGAELVLFPETAEYIGADMMGHASAVPGYVSRRFSSMAKKHKIYVHCGSMTVRRAGYHPSNTSYLFGPNGEICGEYSKMHLFDMEIPGALSYRESEEISPGSRIVLADTSLGVFGMSICYDLRFPEQYRLMERSGAEVFLTAANFTHTTGELHWESLVRARAIENCCYMAAADQCGQKAKFMAHGHSMIVDPLGRVLAEADDTPQVLVAELDPEVLQEARRQIPSPENRRENVYHLESQRIFVDRT